MARYSKVPHDPMDSAARVEETNEKLDRMPLAGFPRDNLPNTYASNKQSVLAELVAIWNSLFKRSKML